MVSVTLEVFVIGFLVVGLVGFTALWLFYDRRDKRFYDRQRMSRSFLCLRCNTLYSSGVRSESVPCPKCGLRNTPLRF